MRQRFLFPEEKQSQARKPIKMAPKAQSRRIIPTPLEAPLGPFPFPKICIWDADGDDITCDIIDAREVCRDGLRRERSGGNCFGSREAKKQGQTILKGHKSYELMLNLQLGIRYTIGKSESAQMRELRPGDFDPGEKYWTRFPPEGSKITPPHQTAEFRWKDYCPIVFRHLRRLFSVDPADYMMAICGSDALRELPSPGKSGSFFYLTQDDRFMIKTVKESEVKVLTRMLTSYHRHVSRYENSLLTKFFGAHCVKPIGGQKVHFIIMGNLLCSKHQIHRRFDLKGSSHGRTTDKAEAEIDENTTLKDLDLNFVFRLQKSWFSELLWQIDQDCKFLEVEGIMDYSLLVGLHFRDDILASTTGMSYHKCSEKSNSLQGRMSEFMFSKSRWKDMDPSLEDRKPVIRLGANMPAWAEHVSRDGKFKGNRETYGVVLYFGIIDILQDYDISKKLEHAYKSLQADPSSISAVDPKSYSKRFRGFIPKIFVGDND